MRKALSKHMEVVVMIIFGTLVGLSVIAFPTSIGVAFWTGEWRWFGITAISALLLYRLAN